MMNRFFLLLVITVSLQSCGSSEPPPIPNDVLVKDSMALIMADLQTLNAMRHRRFVKKYNLQGELQKRYNEVFTNHGISEEVFKSSLEYYKKHPEMLMEIYDETLSELSRRIAEIKIETSISPESRQERPEPSAALTDPEE